MDCNLSPLPVTESSLCFHVSHLANEGLASSSIKSYLSAVRNLQISNGYPDPDIGDMPRLAQVTKGIKVHQAKQGRTSRPRLPITPMILRMLKRVWDHCADDTDVLMLWAATTTCFFGFMRAGELTVPAQGTFDPSVHLSFRDVAFDEPSNPSVMEVRIKASKTDPFRKGVNLYLGRTHNDLCPIVAMLAYLARRGGEDGPLFRFRNGQPLTHDGFTSKIRAALTKIRAA